MGWRRDGNTPHIPAPALFTFYFSLLTSRRDHFLLFTLHFSLPKGTSSAFTMHCGAMPDAACCIGCCSALHSSSHRTAFSDLLLSESLRSIFHFSLFTLHLYHAPHCVFQPIIVRVPAQHFPRFHRVFSCECRRRMTGVSYGAHPVILLSFLI